MTAPSILDPKSLTTQELNDKLWESGSLEHVLHSGQVALLAKYRAWERIDQTHDTKPRAGSLPRMFAIEGGKRFGKTTAILGLMTENAIRRPGSKWRYTSAFSKTIAEIINDVQPALYDRAPKSVRPVYRGKKGPMGAGFYFPESGPAKGSVILLCGLDADPDALRGQACDGDAISEAAFISKLAYATRNILYHQYQGKPHARMILESSAPQKLDTEWELEFLPDARERGAHFCVTIEDNPRLSREEKDEFIAAAGGRGHPDCEREYFNVIAADPKQNVIPEFDASKHVRSSQRPDNAICMTAVDPGMRDLCGIVCGYWDFARAKGVIERSWAKKNASTIEVAAVISAIEYELWGTWPAPKMKLLPLHETEGHVGWFELLKGDRYEYLCETLYDLAHEEQRPDWNGRRSTVRDAPPNGNYVYWDGERYRSNPKTRYSDIDPRLIGDMIERFDIHFLQTSKDDTLEARVNRVRDWFATSRIEIIPESGPLEAHVRAARWNDRRTEWERHKIYGHFDCLAALEIWTCNLNSIRHLRPFPPTRVSADSGATVVDYLPWQTKNAATSQEVADINRALFGGVAPLRRYGISRKPSP